MANDKTFGALDFYHKDTNSDAENELLQYLLLTPPDTHSTQPLLDIQMPNASSQNNGKTFYDTTPNDIPPDVQTFDNIPLPPIQDHELDSDVENEPHTESEPQLPQQ